MLYVSITGFRVRSVWQQPRFRWLTLRAAYVVAGAHRQAMRANRSLGSGKTLGFEAAEGPGWPEALARWRAEAREA